MNIRQMTRATLASVILAASGLVGAAELTPGLWEMTVKLDSPAVPENMRTQVRDHCLTQKQASNPEMAMRESWKAENCNNSEISRSGDTLQWSANCKMPGSKTTTKIRGEMVIHNDKHYSSNITISGNNHSMTTHSEAKWKGQCPGQ